MEPPKTTAYLAVPIGWVESALADPKQAPMQGDEGAPDAWLVFAPEVADGVRDLARGDDLIVLTWLHRADRDVLVTRPRGDTARPMTGVRCHLKARISRQWQSCWNSAPIRTASRETGAVSNAVSERGGELLHLADGVRGARLDQIHEILRNEVVAVGF